MIQECRGHHRFHPQSGNHGTGWPAAAIVTNPINKAILKDAGFSHPGHTEFLASLAPARPGAPLMMLAEIAPCRAGDRAYRASRCSGGADNRGIVAKGRLLNEALQLYFGCAHPASRCGLNPHAGENGQFGDEDQRVIAPAVDSER